MRENREIKATPCAFQCVLSLSLSLSLSLRSPLNANLFYSRYNFRERVSEERVLIKINVQKVKNRHWLKTTRAEAWLWVFIYRGRGRRKK